MAVGKPGHPIDAEDTSANGLGEFSYVSRGEEGPSLSIGIYLQDQLLFLYDGEVTGRVMCVIKMGASMAVIKGRFRNVKASCNAEVALLRVLRLVLDGSLD